MGWGEKEIMQSVNLKKTKNNFSLLLLFIAFHYIAPFHSNTDLGSQINILCVDKRKTLKTLYFG